MHKKTKIFRKKQEVFISSFNTIAGAGKNGAIVHYRAGRKTQK